MDRLEFLQIYSYLVKLELIRLYVVKMTCNNKASRSKITANKLTGVIGIDRPIVVKVDVDSEFVFLIDITNSSLCWPDHSHSCTVICFAEQMQTSTDYLGVQA